MRRTRSGGGKTVCKGGWSPQKVVLSLVVWRVREDARRHEPEAPAALHQGQAQRPLHETRVLEMMLGFEVETL